VKSGTFVSDRRPRLQWFTRYRITLTVVDSDGLQGSQSGPVFPDKVNLSFDRAGERALLNSTAFPSGAFIHDTLIGFQHTIEAPDQTLGQKQHSFRLLVGRRGAASHHRGAPADASYVRVTRWCRIRFRRAWSRATASAEGPV